MNIKLARKRNNGFTLIEVMLVIVLIGLMISVVQFTAGNDHQENQLKQASNKFAGLFEIAAEYGMLNNLELALVVEENSYTFVGFDGQKWTNIAESDVLTTFELPEGMKIELQLEDLPIEEPALYDRETFNVEEDEDEYTRLDEDDEEESKKIVPHVYILSGGDITPFNLRFYYDDSAYTNESLSYQVSGLFTVPLTVDGPITQ